MPASSDDEHTALFGITIARCNIIYRATDEIMRQHADQLQMIIL